MPNEFVLLLRRKKAAPQRARQLEVRVIGPRLADEGEAAAHHVPTANYQHRLVQAAS